jgi:hypothetical protein
LGWFVDSGNPSQTKGEEPRMTELQPKHYDLIMDCLDEFDFDRVHKVMFFLDWKYSDSNDVPPVQELRKNARKYLQEVLIGAIERKNVGDEYITATGGFRYEAKLYPDDYVWLRMAFEIESWDNAE